MGAKPIHAIGRRKSASARVYLFETGEEEEGTITVNDRAIDDYFPREMTRMVVNQPLALTELTGKYNIKVRVKGGGVSGQAGAVRHGIARVLEKADEELRATLKPAGLLTRDSRAVERKKPGRHKARKKPQFSKR